MTREEFLARWSEIDWEAMNMPEVIENQAMMRHDLDSIVPDLAAEIERINGEKAELIAILKRFQECGLHTLASGRPEASLDNLTDETPALLSRLEAGQ